MKIKCKGKLWRSIIPLWRLARLNEVEAGGEFRVLNILRLQGEDVFSLSLSQVRDFF